MHRVMLSRAWNIIKNHNLMLFLPQFHTTVFYIPKAKRALGMLSYLLLKESFI